MLQALQEMPPLSAWNWPWGQSVHDCAFRSGATVPGAHSVSSVEPVEHELPIGQSVHASFDCRPGVFE